MDELAMKHARRAIDPMIAFERLGNPEKILRILYKKFNWHRSSPSIVSPWVHGANEFIPAGPGLYKFAAIISNLRKEGFEIESQRIPLDKRHFRYRLNSYPVGKHS